MPQPDSRLERLEVVDALRGFSLAGIVFVHLLEQYVAGPMPEEVMDIANSGIHNQVVTVLAELLVRGKFFALFSVLFGLSFFLQMDRAAVRNEPYSLRFLWRLVLLFGIGWVHSLFYRGDILTIYALIGVLLLPAFRLPDRALVGLAVLLFLGLGRYLIFALYHHEPIMLAGVEDSKDPAALQYYELLKNGSFWEVAKSNATYGLLSKAEFQVNVFGRAYLTLAFFLVGLWLGRIGFFHRMISDQKMLRKQLFISLGFTVAMLLGVIGVFSIIGAEEQAFTTWLSMVGLTVFDLLNLGFTALIFFGFLMIWNKPGGRRFFQNLIPYGRMALTQYFLQTLIGTWLLFGWGLGLLGKLQNIYLFLIACAMILVQVAMSKWWLTRFRYGPLEWAWRSLTYFKVQPFYRQK